MMDPKFDLRCCNIDSFWEGINVLLIKPSQYRVATFFLIWTRGSIHTIVMSKITWVNQLFKSLRSFFYISYPIISESHSSYTPTLINIRFSHFTFLPRTITWSTSVNVLSIFFLFRVSFPHSMKNSQTQEGMYEPYGSVNISNLNNFIIFHIL